MNEVLIGLIIISGSILFGFVVGFLTGEVEEKDRWRKELIKRGLAEYNSDTGEWKWKQMKYYAQSVKKVNWK